MADKEFLLGNRARELLRYTNQVTKIVTDDISVRDVRVIIQKIAALDDIRDVKMVCQQVIGVLDRKDKKGFTKATYRCYGEDMRMIAKDIVRYIHAANGKMFATWTKKVRDVQYMSMSWRKNDGARAKKIQAEERASVEGWLVSMVKDAIRQIKAGK